MAPIVLLVLVVKWVHFLFVTGHGCVGVEPRLLVAFGRLVPIHDIC